MNRRKFIGTISAFVGLCAAAIGVKSKFSPLPIEEYKLVLFDYDWKDNEADVLADAFEELDAIAAGGFKHNGKQYYHVDGKWRTHEQA